MTLYEIEPLVGAYGRTKRKCIKSFDGFVGPCPSCKQLGKDDSGTNLSVREGGDDHLHLNCQAGCGEDDIMLALGLEPSERRIVPWEPSSPVPDGFPPKPADNNTKYLYKLPNGRVVYIKTRYYIPHDKKPGVWKKMFSQKTPPSAEHPKGEKIDVLGEKARILYNLPDIAKAKKDGLTVFINEGEKAADAFKARGLVGTCTNNGGGKGAPAGKWTPNHTKQLDGVKRVVIVMDDDGVDEHGGRVGEEYARFVASQLWDLVPVVEVVQSKTATGDSKHDAYDHFAAGYDVKDFVLRPDLHPEDDETYSFGSDFQERETEWTIPDYLPRKKCILLDANGGTGKTTLCAYVAAKLSRGEHPFLTRDYKPVMLECGPVKTLYLHKGEDQDDEIETVYRANGGVDGFLIYMKDTSGLKLDDAGIARIRRAIVKNDARLVVMDALYYFLEGLVKSTNDGDEVAPLLQRLNDLAEYCGCTFLNCRHTKKLGGVKAAAQADPAEIGLGSQMARNKHRGQWVARRHPEKKGTVVVTCEKSSLLTMDFEPFAYERRGNQIFLRQEEAYVFDKTPAAERISEMSKAKELIKQTCFPGIPVATATLNTAASLAGISARTIERARRELGVKSYGKQKGLTNKAAGNMILLPLPDTSDGVDMFYEEGEPG